MSDAAQQIVMSVLRGEHPLKIRYLASHETLPADFEAGFDQLGQLDPSWVWIAERRGRMIGCIVASPCHGVALIWRVVSKDGCLLPMLRQFMRDCKTRGLRGYMTLIDEKVKEQKKLQGIIERGGGGTKDTVFSLLASPLVGV